MKRMTSAVTTVLFALIAVALGASMFGNVNAQAPQSTPAPQSAPAPQVPPQAPPAPQVPPAPQATPAPVATDTDHGTALMLLDRVATLLDAALTGKTSKTGAVGTSGYSESLGKVAVDRAALDEIRAEVAQIRLLLKDEPNSSVALRPRETIERAR